MGELIPIVMFIVVAVIVKITSDNRIKRILIEKDMVNENIKYLTGDIIEKYVSPSLKWGIVLTAIGGALLLARLVPALDDEETIVAMMLIGGGLALIFYYALAKSRINKEQKDL